MIFWKIISSLFVIVLLVGGCAPMSQNLNVAPQQAKENQLPAAGWWTASFQINWQEVEPAWYIDAMLAHRVISPALELQKKDILLWRFHRRAIKDETGHQFSFLFYASPAAADRIYALIQRNPDLLLLKSSGLILVERYDDTRSIIKPRIEDTSDSSWSPSVRKSWPYFIMGVSEMWLQLISESAGNRLQGAQAASLPMLKECYRETHKSVEETWQKEGRHALLHHLNALFGYEPLTIQMGF